MKRKELIFEMRSSLIIFVAITVGWLFATFALNISSVFFFFMFALASVSQVDNCVTFHYLYLGCTSLMQFMPRTCFHRYLIGERAVRSRCFD